MNLKELALSNKGLIEFIKSRTPGELDKYYGTLDYATARFNTILLKLSQDRILEDIHEQDVLECDKAIKDFYKYTLLLDTWPGITKPFIRVILHGIGTRRIPKIKRLLNKLENNNEYYHFGDDTV
tara:strand:- start:4101 stop:4475 length:375 start_codon:yes stop_codon:yes gene_type:complete